MLLVIPGAELGLAERHVATFNACWCGDLKAGRVACRTLLDPLGEPLLDTFRELPFSELVSAFADSRLARPGYRNDWEAFTLPDCRRRQRLPIFAVRSRPSSPICS